MIRICHVITRADSIGGAQVHVLELGRAFKAAGLDVHVVSGPTGPLTERLRTIGIVTTELPHLLREIHPLDDWAAYHELREALGRIKPDLVMLHSSKAGWLGRLACRPLGIPAVFTAHGWAFTEGIRPLRRRLYHFAERLAENWADRIITVSRYDRELALRMGIGDAETMTAVHNGVRDVASPLAEPARQPARLVVVARMDVPKEHALLLRALSRLKDEQWTLDLIGDGPDRSALEALTAALGLAERVRFLGSRSDIPERLSQAQLFILPSRWEGLPRSILEAMRAGLPVIASDVGGIPECVQHGVTGVRVPRGNADALSLEIQSLLRDPQRRAALGAAGRRVYEREFTFERMFERTVRILAEVLERRGKVEAARALEQLAAA